jgi:hypothetical protein
MQVIVINFLLDTFLDAWQFDASYLKQDVALSAAIIPIASRRSICPERDFMKRILINMPVAEQAHFV